MSGAALGPERRAETSSGVSSSWLATLSFGVWGLLILALFYTLYFASDFFKPVLGAIVLNLVLSPAIRGMRRHIGLPAPLGASLLVGVLVGGVAYGILAFAQPANQWLNQIPYVIGSIENKISVLKKPVEDVKRATKQVEDAMDVDQSAEQPTVEVKVKQPGVFERLFGTLRQVGLQAGVCLILLFFLLASDQLFKEKLVRAMPRMSDKKNALTVIRRIEHEVATYLATISLINAALGLVIGLGLYLIGMPNPLLWAVMAAGLNFMPYLGALVGLCVVGAVGLASLDLPSQALAAVAIYAGANFTEAYFVTPLVLGRRLTLNAIVVFVVVAFWGWLWGVAGALMAVPLLVTAKAICDQFDSTAPVSEFLSGR